MRVAGFHRLGFPPYLQRDNSDPRSGWPSLLSPARILELAEDFRPDRSWAPSMSDESRASQWGLSVEAFRLAGALVHFALHSMVPIIVSPHHRRYWQELRLRAVGWKETHAAASLTENLDAFTRKSHRAGDQLRDAIKSLPDRALVRARADGREVLTGSLLDMLPEVDQSESYWLLALSCAMHRADPLGTLLQVVTDALIGQLVVGEISRRVAASPGARFVLAVRSGSRAEQEKAYQAVRAHCLASVQRRCFTTALTQWEYDKDREEILNTYLLKETQKATSLPWDDFLERACSHRLASPGGFARKVQSNVTKADRRNKLARKGLESRKLADLVHDLSSDTDPSVRVPGKRRKLPNTTERDRVESEVLDEIEYKRIGKAIEQGAHLEEILRPKELELLRLRWEAGPAIRNKDAAQCLGRSIPQVERYRRQLRDRSDDIRRVLDGRKALRAE